MAGWLLACGAQAGPLRERLAERRADGEAVRVLHDQRYGNAAVERLDVYLPARAQQAPVLLLVHGGGWRRGDKDNDRVVDNKVARWVPRGFVVVSVNYPMLPEADPLAQADAVARALAWVQRQAAGWGADPARVVLMGHSAGAHLVGLLAAEPARVRAAGAQPWLGTVALDSAAFDVPAVMGGQHLRLYDEAFGADPAFWRAASPLQQLDVAGAPLLAVCSSVRRDQPCAQAEAFAARARGLGMRVEVLPEPLSHGQINQQLGLDNDYTRAVERFLASLDGELARRLGSAP
jgi:acetyl esterase/lipase